jgi:hypothetical protein
MARLTRALGRDIAALGKAGGAAIGAAPSSEPIGEQVAVDGINVALAVEAPVVGKLFTPMVDQIAEAGIGFLLRRHSRPAAAIQKAAAAIAPTPDPEPATPQAEGHRP